MCVHVCMLSHVQLCGPMDCSLPDSSLRGLFQARILEWFTISYSRDPPDPGIQSISLVSPELSGGFFTTVPRGMLQLIICLFKVLTGKKKKNALNASTNTLQKILESSTDFKHKQSCCLVTKQCLTLLQPHRLPGFSVHGISQARMQEQVAIYFSRGSSQARHRTCISCIGRWILYHQATREGLSSILAVLLFVGYLREKLNREENQRTVQQNIISKVK